MMFGRKGKVNLIMNSLIAPAVVDIRNELIERYSTTDLIGSCDLACYMLKEKMDKYNFKHNANIKTYIVHGEQRHSPTIKSFKWSIQHTWAYIVFAGIKIYVDPTCGQFRYLYKDIPAYYISTKKPKWFYADIDNPAWNGWTHRINEKIKIKHKIKYPYGTDIASKGIIEFLQYGVWGFISDLISTDSRSIDFTKAE